jgi:hypothetical protein
LAFGTYGDKWPNGTIPYEIDGADFPAGSLHRGEIDRAIAEWNDNSVVRFVPRRDEPDFIVFEDTGDGCNSVIGRGGGAAARQVQPGGQL